MYTINYTERAQSDLLRLKRNEPAAFKKLTKLLNELAIHPRSGTGHPEQLKGNRSNQWSRHITEKHRLVYEIHDDLVVVLVLTAFGHYNDR